MKGQNDQIYIGCKVKILHGACTGEIGEVVDFSVEDNFVDVLVDKASNFVRYLDFPDVEFVE